MKGLIVSVYSDSYGRDKLSVIPETVKGLTVIDSAVSGPFEPSPDYPEVNLVRRVIGGQPYIHAVPKGATGTMFGGRFIYTTDSRLRAVCQYPIPLHDRKE